MESGRMPLPAAWHALSLVGAAGGQGSDRVACVDPQVDRLLWSRQPAQRQIRSFRVHHIQRPILRGFPEATAAASFAGQKDGDCVG